MYSHFIIFHKEVMKNIFKAKMRELCSLILFVRFITNVTRNYNFRSFLSLDSTMDTLIYNYCWTVILWINFCVFNFYNFKWIIIIDFSSIYRKISNIELKNIDSFKWFTMFCSLNYIQANRKFSGNNFVITCNDQFV